MNGLNGDVARRWNGWSGIAERDLAILHLLISFNSTTAGLSSLQTLLEKKIFPRRSPVKKIDPDRSINEYPLTGPFSSPSDPLPLDLTFEI
jgi:hypothetical protein